MARNYRTSAIRGYRATGGDDAGPTPFQGGDVSGGAIFAKLGQSLIARRRQRAAAQETERRAALEEEYTRAQIERMRAQTAADLRPDPTFSLEVPGRQDPSIVGPARPEVITGLKPNEYLTQRRAFYPAPKPADQLAERRVRVGERLATVAEQEAARRRTSSGPRGYPAAQAGLRNLDAEEVIAKGQIDNIALNEATVYANQARSGDPTRRAQALQALGGVDVDPANAAVDFEDYLGKLMGSYRNRRVAGQMVRIREKNMERRRALMSVAPEEAGVDGGSPEEDFLQRYDALANEPDDEEEE